MTNYGPPGGGYPGPWRGQRPDETPDPPAQQPYPPAQQPYPPPQQPYPPSRQPYPPAHQPYPPAQQPYPPAQQPYPPAQQPGPPAQQPYPPAQQSYPPAHQPYSPAGPSYPPASQGPSAPYGGDPAPAPRRRGRGPLIAVLVVVLLLAAVGGAFWLRRGQDDPAPVAAPTDSPAAADPSADADATEPVPSAAAPESSADPRFAKVGQCVRNDAAAGAKPKLLISECVAKSYEVLSRIDGATSGERDAETKCGKVQGYTNWYFFDSELDTLDFVLCLKQR